MECAQLAGAVAGRRVLGAIAVARGVVGPLGKREQAPALQTLARAALPAAQSDAKRVECVQLAGAVAGRRVLGAIAVARGVVGPLGKREQAPALQTLARAESPAAQSDAKRMECAQLAGAVAGRRVLGAIAVARGVVGPLGKREQAPALQTLARAALPAAQSDAKRVECVQLAGAVAGR